MLKRNLIHLVFKIGFYKSNQLPEDVTHWVVFLKLNPIRIVGVALSTDRLGALVGLQES